jgi:hypothetical protein
VAQARKKLKVKITTVETMTIDPGSLGGHAVLAAWERMIDEDGFAYWIDWSPEEIAEDGTFNRTVTIEEVV